MAPPPPPTRARWASRDLEDEPTVLDEGLRRRKMTVQQAIHAKLVRAFTRSELTIAQLAIRTGLSRRTIERVLGGVTCELTTVERIATSLRVVLVVVEPGEER